MKKLLSILCAAALTLSLAACGSSTENYAGQTLTGQVTAIDGSAVTLQLGELTEDTNTPPDLQLRRPDPAGRRLRCQHPARKTRRCLRLRHPVASGWRLGPQRPGPRQRLRHQHPAGKARGQLRQRYRQRPAPREAR